MQVRKHSIAWLTPELRDQAERKSREQGQSMSEWLREATDNLVDAVERGDYHPYSDPVFSPGGERDSANMATTAPPAVYRRWQSVANRLGWSVSQLLATATLLQITDDKGKEGE